MNAKDIKHKSKFLSLILRHQPEKINLILDNNGWANIDELIEKSKTKKIYFDFDQLTEIIESNNKKRFTFNEKKLK